MIFWKKRVYRWGKKKISEQKYPIKTYSLVRVGRMHLVKAPDEKQNISYKSMNFIKEAMNVY